LYKETEFKNNIKWLQHGTFGNKWYKCFCHSVFLPNYPA